MKEQIERVVDEMSTELTAKQLRVLQSVLIRHFAENIKNMMTVTTLNVYVNSCQLRE